jgi:Peptidase S24-like
MTMLDAVAEALDAGAEAVKFRPSGNSMMPRIRHKELVTVYPVPDKALLRPGDIVLARVHGVTRLHQILAVDHPNKRVETGNMKRHSDGYITYHAVHGIRLTVEQASACADRESARNAQEAASATLADARASA